MRIIVSGTRRATMDHHQQIGDALLSALVCTRARGPHTLVHGAAVGVDRIAARLAQGWGWTVESRPADWNRNGKVAGPMRNTELIVSTADLVIAFPATVDSPGTWDLIRKAVAAGLRVNIRPLRIEEATLL